MSLELVFRQIPGQSIQRWRMPRLRPFPFRQRRPLLQSVRNRVPRVDQPPRRLRLRTPLPLAFLLRARPLPLPDPCVRPEPFSTKPAGPFVEPRAHRGHAHRNSRVPLPPLPMPRSRRGWTTSGEQTRTTSQERLSPSAPTCHHTRSLPPSGTSGLHLPHHTRSLRSRPRARPRHSPRYGTPPA